MIAISLGEKTLQKNFIEPWQLGGKTTLPPTAEMMGRGDE
jgi:hypothetical protein